jgi:RND family efflux transporter MFP subunit
VIHKQGESNVKAYVTLAVLCLLAASCGDGDDMPGAEIAVPVSVQEVRLQPIEEYIVGTGTVRAAKEVTMKSEAAGFYRLLTNPDSDRPYALSDFVTTGRVIVRLDNPERESEIKISSKKLALETSRREFEKQQSLYEKGGVTLGDLRESERAYMDADYNLQNAEIQLAKLDVRAPFDGIITSLPYHTAGVKVDAGEEIAQIMDYRELYLEVDLPGKELGEIKVDQAVRVMSYAMPDDTLDGRVTQVSPALDPDSRSFKASIYIDNPDWLFRPGMFVKTEIVVARKDSAVVVPKEIVLAKRKGTVVFVVEKGTARERLITTGLENPDVIEVLEGLKIDERLVVEGYETLRNRAKVKIVR